MSLSRTTRLLRAGARLRHQQASELNSVFTAIAQNLANLRLAK